MKCIKNHDLRASPLHANFDLLHFLTCRFSYSILPEIRLTISCLFSATHPPLIFTSLDCCKEMICNLFRIKDTESVVGSGWVGRLFPRNAIWEGYRWCIVFLCVQGCSFLVHRLAQLERFEDEGCLRFCRRRAAVSRWQVRCCCRWGRSRAHPRSTSWWLVLRTAAWGCTSDRSEDCSHDPGTLNSQWPTLSFFEGLENGAVEIAR